MKNQIKKRKADGLLPGLLFALAFVFFCFFYDHHLFFSEQLQIFMLTSDHFISCLSKPAFLSSWTGDFLTQFFYLKGGGAFVILITSLILWLIVRELLLKTGYEKKVNLPSIIPVLLTWAALGSIHYPVSVLISFIMVIAFTLVYFRIRTERIRIITGAILIPLLYVLAGGYFWFFTFAIIVHVLFRSDEKARFIYIALFAVIAIIVPLLLKGFYLLTAWQSLTYLSEMTLRSRVIDYLPVISLIIILLLVFYEGKVKRQDNRSVLLVLILPVFYVISGLCFATNTDFRMEKILRLDREASRNRWERVYELSKKYGMRNRLSAYYTNMAMAKLGLLPEKLMEHYQPAATGLFIPVNADEDFLTITLSNEVYWHLGDVNSSQHAALLGMIFSPRAKNTRLMKRLVEINVVNREYGVAEKYINILAKTMFHRRWAEARRLLLYNEEECEKTGWVSEKRTIIPAKDLLRKEGEYRLILELLIESNPGNRMAVDYLLCFDLLDRNLPAFVDNLVKYYRSDARLSLPQVYQEGLLISIASGRNTPEDFNQYIFDPENIKRIAEYIRIYDAHGGDGRFLEKDFGNTYWFYYHFAVMKQEKKGKNAPEDRITGSS
ncbi:MAG: hypothetical protein K0B05_09540 [Bacteroidales bacterium]|nr:hypothetical protein [Bacteroidales bacterium]